MLNQESRTGTFYRRVPTAPVEADKAQEIEAFSESKLTLPKPQPFLQKAAQHAEVKTAPVGKQGQSAMTGSPAERSWLFNWLTSSPRNTFAAVWAKSAILTGAACLAMGAGSDVLAMVTVLDAGMGGGPAFMIGMGLAMKNEGRGVGPGFFNMAMAAVVAHLPAVAAAGLSYGLGKLFGAFQLSPFILNAAASSLYLLYRLKCGRLDPSARSRNAVIEVDAIS